jgi:polyhydroxyalkanoate synthase
MFDFKAEQYDQYKLEYNKFVSSKNAPTYFLNSFNTEYVSEIVELLKYPAVDATKSKKIFIIIPSIFNSPEILFLNKQQNFIENLQYQGDVYLVNWLENDQQLLMADYVHELKKIIQMFTNQSVDLIGHCIGGNISIALAEMDNIRSLTLLTCPWDYSHFDKWLCVYYSLGLDKSLENHEFIPKIYIQIMFFLMFPGQFQEKINKYFELSLEADKELFMQVEDWLQSGNKISKSIYREITKDFCQRNILHNKNWYIGEDLVELQNIKVPVCIVYAKDDQIAPYISMEPLQKQIKNTTLIEVEGGHIGYLISSKSRFRIQYNQWLLENR